MTKWEKIITLEQAEREVTYDPETGIFTRISTDRVAGSLDSCGHRQIRICGRLTMAHRLAWLFIKGEWPSERLDHEDGNPDHNWWSNLRLATPAQNTCNSRLRPDNKCGLKGASFHKGTRKWQATVAGKYLGLFDSPEAAHAAYRAEAVKRFGEFARFA